MRITEGNHFDFFKVPLNQSLQTKFQTESFVSMRLFECFVVVVVFLQINQMIFV